MIGNRLDPQRGLAILCEGLSRVESNFESKDAFLRAFPTSRRDGAGCRTFDNTIYAELIHDLNIESRNETFNGIREYWNAAGSCLSVKRKILSDTYEKKKLFEHHTRAHKKYDNDTHKKKNCTYCKQNIYVS